MTNELKIKKIDVTQKTPLYRKYNSQYDHQSAYLHISPENGDVWFDYDAEIGGAVTSDVWHGRTIRVPITPFLTAKTLNNILIDPKIIGLIEGVIAGHAENYNGSNYVGTLDDTAQSQLQQLERELLDYEPEFSTAAADDWFQNCPKSELIEDGETTENAAERLHSEAWDEGFLVDVEDIVDYLTD